MLNWKCTRTKQIYWYCFHGKFIHSLFLYIFILETCLNVCVIRVSHIRKLYDIENGDVLEFGIVIFICVSGSSIFLLLLSHPKFWSDTQFSFASSSPITSMSIPCVVYNAFYRFAAESERERELVDDNSAYICYTHIHTFRCICMLQTSAKIKFYGSKKFFWKRLYVRISTENWLKCSDSVWIMSIDKKNSSLVFCCFTHLQTEYCRCSHRRLRLRRIFLL